MPTTANEKTGWNNQTVSPGMLDAQTLKSGTTAEMNAFSSPIQGMKWYATDTTIIYYYNGTSWVPSVLSSSEITTALGYTPGPINPLLGDGSDGNVTISSNTDLGSSNNKYYNNLTINSGFSLTGNSGMKIRVLGTLTFGNSSSKIHVDGKGSSGGTAEINGTNAQYNGAGLTGTGGSTNNAGTCSGGGGAFAGSGGAGVGPSSGGGTATSAVGPLGLVFPSTTNGGGGGGGSWTATGGTGGGLLFVFANTIVGTGIISSNGTNGANQTSTGTSVNGAAGAGSGGYVLVYSPNALPAITISANGGIGGNASTATTNYGGGGGFAGAISEKSSAATVTASGGAAGTGAQGNGNPGSAGINMVL